MTDMFLPVLTRESQSIVILDRPELPEIQGAYCLPSSEETSKYLRVNFKGAERAVAVDNVVVICGKLFAVTGTLDGRAIDITFTADPGEHNVLGHCYLQ